MNPPRSKRTLTARTCTVALSLALTVAGCSFSDSSASISKSVSSPFTSSSASSGSESGESYENDVRDTTAAHIAAGGNSTDLRQRIEALAEEHGVSNWEADETTYRGIGAGLAKSGYRKMEVEAFASAFTDIDKQRQWILKGFDDAK